MTDYTNYTLLNATSLSEALTQTGASFYGATGYDVFFVFIWILFFFTGAIIGARFGQMKAVLYAALMGDFVGFFLTSAGMLNPMFLIFGFVLTLPIIFFAKD